MYGQFVKPPEGKVTLVEGRPLGCGRHLVHAERESSEDFDDVA